MRKLLGPVVAMLCAACATAAAGNVTFADDNIFPESVTALEDGTVIAGSLLQPYIYRAAKGAARAERWIDLTAVGSITYGVLADPGKSTLWACTVANPVPYHRVPPPNQRHTTLRAFDLATGAAKGAWPLPGITNACNDITVAHDGTVYASDAGNGQIVRLKPGAGALEVWYKGPETAVVDGITFIGPTLYFSHLRTGRIYRMAINPDGSAAAAVELRLSEPLTGPDGMRAWNGKLYVADNRQNRVVELSLDGDAATVRTLRGGFQVAAGVAPVAGRLWVAEMKANFWSDPALAGASPNPFTLQSLDLP
jgi:outer membrane protein assembly factor BamB